MPLTAEPCGMQCVEVVNGKWLCRVSQTVEQQTDFPRHSFWFTVGASRDENDRCNVGIAVGRNLPKYRASSMACPARLVLCTCNDSGVTMLRWLRELKLRAG